MKPYILLFFCFFTVKNVFAQHGDYGYGNSQDIIKQNRVKTLAIYYFRNELDSTLTAINTFDSWGNLLSYKKFSKDGNVITSDTSIYDANHYLVKKIQYEGNKEKHVMTYINNADGKLLSQTVVGDSMYYYNSTIYDENGRLIKAITYGNNVDTTLYNSFYNKKGLLVKNIILDKINGNTVITTDYNAKGRIASKKKVVPGSEYFTVFKYKPNGDNYVVTTTVTT
ncbi:MAG TPA: hypothetical protein VK489_14710, partial [Ferruginibacter sp.]|nr:hypothetical protein [Ferruginibacter sp.]